MQSEIVEVDHRDMAWTASDRGGLCVPVMSAIGRGETLLSAFDAALDQCGIQNYNLLVLSSVIPAASEIVVCGRYEASSSEHGHKLYVVKSDIRSSSEGAVIAAGLGWLQWGDGRGIFVEHELQSRDQSNAAIEVALKNEISASLADLARRRDIAFVPDQAHSLVVSTVVGPLPTCALVLALYQADGWSRKSEASFEGRSL